MFSFNSLVNSIILVCLLTIFDGPLETRTLPIEVEPTIYTFHVEPAEWAEARKICQAEGGDLAVVNSREEAQVLVDISNGLWPMDDVTFKNVAYIGMRENPKENWLTIHNVTLAEAGFDEWSDKWGGQPDNDSDEEYCGGLLDEGTLDDTPCISSLPFFCELPVKYPTAVWPYYNSLVF